MNLNLSIEQNFRKYLVSYESNDDDYSTYRFRFDNCYGASVIKKPCSLGYERDLWELAVLYFPEANTNAVFEITTLPNDEDVFGFLNENDVNNLLWEIVSLKGEE